MDAKLVGIHKVKAKLSGGREAVYFYAWRGGPRMESKPGTKAFTLEFIRLTKSRPKLSQDGTVGSLLDAFLTSADYQKLRASTKKDYDRSLGLIRAQFGTMPLVAVEARGSRKAILDWRDTMRSTPRAADLNVAVFARILSWAKDREEIMRNPLERVSKLHDGTRKNKVWMPSQLDMLLTKGAPHVVKVATFALLTMQRQGDLLAMPTIAYDGGRLWIRQGKTGARVQIAPPADLIPVLDQAKRSERQRVLENSFGQNWTSSGFRASWRKELSRLEIKGVTFHDLRGTGITYAYSRGVEIERIAEISGHSKAECETIIRKHYLAGADVIEAIRGGPKTV